MDPMDEVAEFDSNMISQEALRFMHDAWRRNGRAGDADRMLNELGLVRDDGYTLAGALLLSRRPDLISQGAYVKMGVFDSEGNLVSQDSVAVPLVMLPSRAISKLYEKHMEGRFVYGDGFMGTRYDFPPEVVSEAVLNAVMHRDYSSGYPVEVRIHPDRVVVLNDGTLPEGWDTGSLMDPEHRSKSPNIRLMEVFKALGIAEGWGRGVNAMVDGCVDAGVLGPFFRVSDGVSVEFRLPVKAYESEFGDDLEQPDIHTENRALEETLLDYIEAGELRTGPELSAALGINRRRFTRMINRLTSGGVIVREGNRRKGRWIVVNRDCLDDRSS